MQKIAFIVQDLSNPADSVANDCIFQYRTLREEFSSQTDVYLFAEVLPPNSLADLGAVNFSTFYELLEEYPDTLVIYHFCDGWDEVDPLLGKLIKNVIVRWHNNTPPWFYALDSYDFASGCLRGFEVMMSLAKTQAVHFMVNSEFSAKQLEALGARKTHIKVVYPGSRILERELVPLRKSPDVSQDRELKLLFVGRVVPHKGHRHILVTASAVRRYLNRPVRVIFVGSLEDRLSYYWSGLKDIALEEGIELELTGPVNSETLSEKFASSDVFVCLSEHEGFGLPVFEAMHSSLPVVAWNSSAFKELLIGHPLASDSFDVFRFAACICKAIEKDTREYVLAEQNKFIERYNLDLVRKQVVGVVRGQVETFLPSQRQLDPNKFATLVTSIDRLADEIEALLGDKISVFPHDSAQNLVSQYDLPSYRLAIEANRMKTEEAGGVPIVITAAPAEIHPHADVIDQVLGDRVLSGNPRDYDLSIFDDEVFLRLAYQACGKERELWRFNKHLHRLRQGADKTSILDELAEVRQVLPQSNINFRTRKGVLRRVFDAIRDSDGDYHTSGIPWLESDARRLERIEDSVLRLSRALMTNDLAKFSSNPMGAVHDIYALLKLNNSDFVSNAYKLLLGRSGDPGGVSYYRQRLEEGEKRSTIVKELASSPEGIGRISLIEGLREFLAGLSDDHTELDKSLENDGLLAHRQRLMRLENQVGRLVNSLIGDLSAFGGARRVSRKCDGAENSAVVKIISISPKAVGPRNSLHASDYKVEKIHQIYITQSGELPAKYPPIVERNILSIQSAHPTASYKMWSLHDLREFIEENFAKDVLAAFDQLQAFALKADLGRYCLLYKEGGLYSDLSNFFLGPLIVRGSRRIAFFREHKPLHGAVWMAQNSIIYAEAGQLELKAAIDLVVENVKNREYGISSLAPSGPVLFGRVFALANRADSYQVGEAVNLQVDGGLNRACYVSDDGSLIAVRLQGGGGRPDELGLRGTNVYGQMWEKGQIYSENQLSFSGKHPALRSGINNGAKPIIVDLGQSGNFLFGPYVELPRGLYRATLWFHDVLHRSGVSIDVVCRSGGEVLARSDVEALSEDNSITIDFFIDEKEFDVEVRSFTDGKFAATVGGLVISLVDSSSIHADSRVVEPADQPTPSFDSSVEFVHYILDSTDEIISLDKQKNLEAAVSLHPGALLNIWSLTELRAFISDHFDPKVIQAYDRLDSRSAKAELGKYCVLYILGGLYLDADIVLTNAISLTQSQKIVCFRADHVRNCSSWSIDSRLLFCLPGQIELFRVINEVATSVFHEDKGNQLDPQTSGSLFGKSLAVSYRAENYSGGEAISITPGYRVRNICYLGQDGRLIGVLADDQTLRDLN